GLAPLVLKMSPASVGPGKSNDNASKNVDVAPQEHKQLDFDNSQEPAQNIRGCAMKCFETTSGKMKLPVAVVCFGIHVF
ncbi:hypothetical protein Q9966_006537, partial [Columba livia]